MDDITPAPVAFHIRPVDGADRAWVLQTVLGWGADFIISRGRKVYPQELPAFCAVSPDGERVGLATYEIAATPANWSRSMLCSSGSVWGPPFWRPYARQPAAPAAGASG